MLDRLDTIWKAVCTCIRDNDLMTKKTIRKAEKTVLSIVEKIRNSKDNLKMALGLHFSEQRDDNRFLEIVEDIEKFFDEVLEVGDEGIGLNIEDDVISNAEDEELRQKSKQNELELNNAYEQAEEGYSDDSEDSEELDDFNKFGKILGVIEMRDRIRKFERVVRKKFGQIAN